MCSLGDLKFVMENIYFPIEYNKQVDYAFREGDIWYEGCHTRFDTLCNVYNDDELNNVYFLLKWLGENSYKLNNDDKIPPGIYDLIKKKIVKSKIKGMSFYTIVSREKIPDKPENIKKLEEFCEVMFHKRGKMYFKQVWYVIETGKHVDKSNLHIHVLADFKDMGSKYFLRDLKNNWLKFFPDKKNDITYKLPPIPPAKKGNEGILNKPCNKQDIIDDKIDYMDNKLKGTHENYRDLGLRFHHVFEG